MRNLRPYQGQSFDFHNAILESKRNTDQDPTYKDRVRELAEVIEQKFEEYDENFEENTLDNLECHGYQNIEKSDLLKLYRFKSRLIQELKLEVTTSEFNRRLNTCQNCTISEINSMDHFVSKEEFPEYTVHPKNIFPSCTTCNSYKNKIWRIDGRIQFLNLYLDELPEQQYLFVNIGVELEENVITTEFYIDNRNNIDEAKYNLIRNHYERLHLCERFERNNDVVISPLENIIRTFSQTLEIEEVKELIEETSLRNKIYYGQNYWKSILEIALVNNEDFLSLVSQEQSV
ncbi:hypothetical protein [Draconibacterium halophilum]|uniref:HNH endonuclease n=1 Tax=Draconibacterium halophilum TaxID=2706887 RepID=A0A6C0R9T3_9BACT|nr:hypothetical protein [Draconibacterium halophilum]QIA07130.1 hypothetical protein G0Q07_05025 [Draconibacterium halophilum]